MEQAPQARPAGGDGAAPEYRPSAEELDAVLHAGRAHHRAGSLPEAEQAYRAVLAHRPEDPDALHLLGLLACQVDEPAIGIELIRRAIAADPSVAAFHVNLGNALAAERRPEESAAAFRQALELDPDCVDALCNLGTLLKRSDKAQALDLYHRALARDPDHAESHFGLAGVLRRLDRFAEAERHYRRALELRPSLTPVHRELARFLYIQQRFEEAAAVYREWLRVRPDDPIARHNLAAIVGEELPRASDAFVRQLFDDFAPGFDQVLAELDYCAPALVGAALRAVYGAPEGRLEVLDLGCGTGLCGVEARPFARNLTGVDLSAGMLERAKARGLYDQLVAAELTAFLQSAPAAAYDVLLSGDTLVYFGALDAVFAAAARALKPGGCLIFTVERLDEPGRDHRIMPYGRYRHRAAYIEAALAQAGFRCRLERAVLRQEAGADVHGLVAVAERETA